MIDYAQIAIYIGVALLGAILASIIIILKLRQWIPGLVPQIYANIKGLPLLINAWMDGYSEYKVLSKEESGSMIFNAGSPDEIVDRSTFDHKPMMSLEGQRIMLRASASSTPNTMDELAPITQVLDHVYGNKEKYPLLSKLKSFEVFGAIGHDPQTVRELMAYHSRVQKEYFDEQGKKHERTNDEINAAVSENVEKYMKEIDLLKKNLQFVPKRDLFIDVGRAVEATQLRIAPYILKMYRTEIENYYRAKFGNQQNEFWKGIVLGVLGGAFITALGLKLLGVF